MLDNDYFKFKYLVVFVLFNVGDGCTLLVGRSFCSMAISYVHATQ